MRKGIASPLQALGAPCGEAFPIEILGFDAICREDDPSALVLERLGNAPSRLGKTDPGGQR